jgi:hypothetical protein
MYLAYHKLKNRPCYTLRESCYIDGQLTFKDLFDLGPDPAVFIKYAGGTAFYFDDAIEDTITRSGSTCDTDDLEDLFWPWIRPDIRVAIETFKSRSSKKITKKLDDAQEKQINQMIHSFDKRRALFLKFGRMDQGALENMPHILFKNFLDCSRDEIEQYFLKQEFILKVHELKTYVYTVFNLQQLFESFMAKKMSLPFLISPQRILKPFLRNN